MEKRVIGQQLADGAMASPGVRNGLVGVGQEGVGVGGDAFDVVGPALQVADRVPWADTYKVSSLMSLPTVPCPCTMRSEMVLMLLMLAVTILRLFLDENRSTAPGRCQFSRR
jgi:hypothetical protein